MSTLPPRPKVRHLRLVPPLPAQAWPDGAPATGGEVLSETARTVGRPGWGAYREAPYLHHTGALLHGPQPFPWPMGDTPSWLKWTTVGLTFVLLLWLCGGPSMLTLPAPHSALAQRYRPHDDMAGVQAATIEPGPSFQLYARQSQGSSLGRPLHNGDPLYADDHIVLGIHNAPSPGAEAAQFAAVFALDQEHHIAALYPALGATAVAMPLPQVASMALMDGPKLTGATGAVTLVAVFLRNPVNLGALMEALTRGLQGAQAGVSLGEELHEHVVRLQSVTLQHSAAPHTAG